MFNLESLWNLRFLPPEKERSNYWPVDGSGAIHLSFYRPVEAIFTTLKGAK